MKKRFIFYSMMLMLVLVTGILGIVIAEVYLRAIHSHDSYPEKLGRGYGSLYSTRHNDGSVGCITTHYPHDFWINESPEFKNFFKVNSLGFSDKEWTLSTGGCRVACFGDSFTEGIGATNDSSYTAILQRILQRLFPSIEVMNWGITGTDPVGNLCLLKTVVVQYCPDIITVTINQTDIDEVIVRGGSERFSGVVAGTGPAWERWYARFRIIRWIVHEILGLNSLFLTPKEYAIATQDAIHIINGALDEFHSFSQHNGIKCIFIFNPMARDGGIQNIIPIMAHVKSHGYEYVDAIGYFRKLYPTCEAESVLYWKTDGHYNNKGYALLAEVIDQVLRKNL